MAGLGTLTLNLVTQIGQFIEPLEQAENAATDATDNIAEGFSLAGAAATAFGALLAGASVAGVYEYITGIMKAADELEAFAKLANSSVSQFQYYSKGASVAGISMEQFADQMKDMQDRIGDFQQSGGGPLVDFFENIAPLVGVTIQQFQKLSGPEAMQLFYDSLVKVGATQNDIKFYMEGIISDSSKLIPLLENGGAGFKRFGDNALAAGSIMSTDVVGGLSEANKNLIMMMEYWTGLKVALVENVAPAISFVVENFDEVKAVALALGAAIAARLVVQLGMLSVQFVQGVIQGVQYQMTLAAMAGQTITLATATATLRASMMSLIGGPAGVAVLAIQAVAAGAAFMYMRKESDDLKPSLDSQNISVQGLVDSYVRLDDAAKRTQVRAEGAKLTELQESYANASSKLISLTVAMGRFDGSSDTAVKAANDLAMQYKQGDITAEQFAQKINGLNGVSEESKAKIDAQASAVGKAKSEMQKQQVVVDSLAAKNQQLSATHGKVTTSVNAQAQAYQFLTKKQRDALDTIKGGLERENYINLNMKAGWSREKAEYYADYRDSAGLGYNGKPLSQYELKNVEQGYKLKLATEAREESEKEIEESQRKQAESQKKQAEEAAKKYKYTKEEIAQLQKVSELASKYNFKAIEEKNGLPKNTLAAVMMQESSGKIDAKSPKGAIGPFQTTGIFRKNYDLSVADSYDVEKIANVAAKDIASSMGVFGNLKDAITAYNAGVAGTKNLLNKGFTGSSAKTREAKNYAPAVDKWRVYLNGSDQKNSGFMGESPEKTLQDYQEFLDKTAQLKAESLARQVAVVRKYASEEQQIVDANLDAIKEIEAAYAADDENRKKYLTLQKVAYQKDINEYSRAQIAKSLNERKALLESQRNWISAGEYASEYYEIIRQEIFNDPSSSQEVMDAQYRAVGIEEEENKRGSWNQYRSAIGVDTSFEDDLDYRNAAITEAFERQLITQQEYQDALLASEAEYYNSKAAMGLASANSTMNGLTDLMGSMLGEQSTAYKAMFAMSKGFAIAQAVMNAPQTYSNVYTSASLIPLIGPYIAPVMAGAAVAVQLAQATQIKGVQLSGQAHGGIDNIPREGTWLLNGGERVLQPEANKDLTNYLANSKGSGVNVIVNVPAGHQAIEKRSADGTVTIDIVKQEIQQAFGRLSRANSFESQSAQQAFGLEVARG